MVPENGKSKSKLTATPTKTTGQPAWKNCLMFNQYR